MGIFSGNSQARDQHEKFLDPDFFRRSSVLSISMTTKKQKDLSKDEDFLHAAFRGYDKNKDGKISLNEFKRVMSRSTMSKRQIEDLVKAADLDGNGYVDYEEFVKMMQE